MNESAPRGVSPSEGKQDNRPPFNQRIRINLLRVCGAILFFPILLIRPYLDETVLGCCLEIIGVILIFVCLVGRCWAILYLGGNKNVKLTTTGPYSLCRHPLYLFSIVGVVGVGFMLQSVVYTVVLTSVTFLIHLYGIRKEEAYLSDKFGEAYVAYRNSTPRFIPMNFRAFQTEPLTNVNVGALRRCFGDTSFFVLAIPALEIIEWIHESNAVATFVLF